MNFESGNRIYVVEVTHGVDIVELCGKIGHVVEVVKDLHDNDVLMLEFDNGVCTAMMPVQVLRDFDTEEDAIGAMYDDVDDPCVDNVRFAYRDDLEACEAFDDASRNGCCGSYYDVVSVNGRSAHIGCNYGH